MANTLLQNYFTDIKDLPAINWVNYHNEIDFKYFRKDYSKGNEKQDVEAYKLCLQSYYDEFGIGDKYVELNQLLLEKIEIDCQIIETGNILYVNLQKVLNTKIENILKETDGITLEEFIIHVENWRKFEINLEKTSTKKLYLIFKVYEQQNKPNTNNKLIENGENED